MTFYVENETEETFAEGEVSFFCGGYRGEGCKRCAGNGRLSL